MRLTNALRTYSVFHVHARLQTLTDRQADTDHNDLREIAPHLRRSHRLITYNYSRDHVPPRSDAPDTWVKFSTGRCASARRHGPHVARWGFSRRWRDRVGFFLEAGWRTTRWVGWGWLGLGRERGAGYSLFPSAHSFYARAEYEFLHKKDRRSVGGDMYYALG